ncbi:nitrite reductase small subunit [Nocardioides sp. Root1257]|uniref:nitrite reductase small subunit NirD n=1 Tax=unclassified Nocardioides TaxID=2615069 RepID=UPI0007015844|nr:MULTISPECIES: nitrite reductase small subunit NirD [unclassified Nocardioides]KQW48594.1 nitrite reductase small subunit [Nocardioides sp. Root1257]KRC47770.1 nitrite reductase small subunit [Nocardioides sp. Root224]
MTSAAHQRAEEWQPVCRIVELTVERGATALVHGQAIAIFRTQDDEVYALGNHDPFAKASVLAKGIVGTREGVPFVASPAHKHAFDLRSGRCLDDQHVSVPAYDVRVVEGVVLVGHRKVDAA